MKKIIAKLLLAFFLVMNVTLVIAQDKDPKKDTADKKTAEATKEEPKAEEKPEGKPSEETKKVPDVTMHQAIKQKFIEGDWSFMTPVAICLIIGLAVALERVITLNMATTNVRKFEKKIEEALQSGGIEAAKEVAVNTRGPVASIYAQGLMRHGEGIDMVEKSVVSYGSVEMGRLESGLIWISLFIALAPMLGFLGTVVGMIQAFDTIQAAGDISPTIVAGGIKVALLTTVAGLIVAIILQILYNYISNKVSSIVGQMEDSSITLIDMLVAYNRK
jgi:biopolymer transport protein ExbB